MASEKVPVDVDYEKHTLEKEQQISPTSQESRTKEEVEERQEDTESLDEDERDPRSITRQNPQQSTNSNKHHLPAPRLQSSRSRSSARSQRSYHLQDGYTIDQPDPDSPVEQNDHSKDLDAYEVSFSGEDDPYNPRSLPTSRKWLVVFIISASSLCVTCASAMYTSTYRQLEREFHVSREVATLGLTTFVCGLGLGPMFLSPLSEFYGRRIVYICAFGMYLVWLVPCAVANNITCMLFVRFFDGLAGSAFLSVAGGTVGDMFRKDQLSAPMMVYTASPFVGPELGFINQYTDWRWTFRPSSLLALMHRASRYFPFGIDEKNVTRMNYAKLACLDSASTLTVACRGMLSLRPLKELKAKELGFVAVDITNNFVKLMARMRRDGHSALIAVFDASVCEAASRDPDEWRNILLLYRYVLIIWAGVQWLLLVTFVPETYAPVLLRRKAIALRQETGDQRWKAPIEIMNRSVLRTVLWSCIRPFQLLFFEQMCLNLCLLSAILLGIFVGMLAGVSCDPLWRKNYIRLVENNNGVSEPEFRLPPTILGALIVPVSLFVPIVFSIFFGLGNIFCFSGIFTFLVEAYPLYAASALAANSFARSSFAAAVLFFYYGKKYRGRSRFALAR
ncbi:hypothetical protein AC578_3613 [Pseudocercospora eumusae]|uniref:Major facilitator superfamily (MFS) profile domain-containing protein n=1 Tax=Pseudocercospora eumusae TaxID=321146 RepID=A0A139HPI8_9PEZI|nr:hypothetical protein AC578_3613 [Pseudocercospora eumusae]